MSRVRLLQFPEHNSVVAIRYMSDPESPREWDNLGECVFFHKRYKIGDEHEYDKEDFESFKEMEKHMLRNGARVVLPVYMYDHSGITISTSPFGDPWDSGQLGFIIATSDKIRECYSVKRISRALEEKVRCLLIQEIATLDEYIRGEVFEFSVIREGSETDSCGGFYGDNAENGIRGELPFKVEKETYIERFNKSNWEDGE